MDELYSINIINNNLSKYKITKDGKIWSISRNRFLNIKITNGYENITLCDKTYSIHRLVALTFIKVPEKYNNFNTDDLIVNHIDCNKLNNNLNNLEWLTQKENVNHHGKDTSHKKKIIQLDLNNNIINKFDSLIEASEKTGINKSSISKVLCGKNTRSGIYKWDYDNILEDLNILEKDNNIKSCIITDYPNYKIYSDGRVYGLVRNKFLSPVKEASGYSYVTLINNNIKKNCKIHILVAKAFIKNDNLLKNQVNHINKNRSDNNVANLEWVTCSENMIHANK
jgi:hypothetical protein